MFAPDGLVARLTEFAQAVEIAEKQRFLFWARPPLELRLALAGFGKGRIDFDSQQVDGNVERGCTAGLTRYMVPKALLQIN